MNTDKAFSFLKGYSFFFNDEGAEIRAWFSALTGLERIYVNGVLVSSQRNISINSTNNFQVGGCAYAINISVENLIKGTVVCTLSKNGIAYKCKKLVFSKKEPIWFSLIVILGGLTIGVSASFLKFPSEYFYALIAVFIFIVIYIGSKFRKPIIEDVMI